MRASGGVASYATRNGESVETTAHTSCRSGSNETVWSAHTPFSRWKRCGEPTKVSGVTSMHTVIGPAYVAVVEMSKYRKGVAGSKPVGVGTPVRLVVRLVLPPLVTVVKVNDAAESVANAWRIT